ncbi:MAG TPA: hypothetical protein VM008_05420 [Phycisphaerae bacterium]|nr:hypothetical protein [Phycisphaerae bacterium]
MAITKKKFGTPTQADFVEIYNMLGELNTAIRSKRVPATLKEADAQLVKLNALVATCKQLGGDAKDPAYFKSRMGAAELFYKGYNEAVDAYNAKLAHVEVEVKPSSPEKIIINGDQSKFKKACGLPSDFDDLITQMKIADNYSPTSVAGQFTPRFNKHEAHVTGNGNEWKAYVEKGTKNTKWRQYFTTKFDASSQTLTITLTKCQQDH